MVKRIEKEWKRIEKARKDQNEIEKRKDKNIKCNELMKVQLENGKKSVYELEV